MSVSAVKPLDKPLGQAGAPKVRLDYLDGLRALAALWVVLGHIWMYRNGMAAHTGLLGALTNWALYNHLAVDVFIVLSGFCLMLPVMKTGSLVGGPWNFFKRRARRILPPLYLSFILTTLYIMLGQWRQHQPIGFDRTTILLNLALLQDLFPASNIINGVWWSVALEYKIYFLFPLFIVLYFRYGAIPTLTVAGVIGYGLTAVLTAWQPHQEISWAQTAPWYVLLFAMGVCACAIAVRPVAAAQKNALLFGMAGSLIAAGVLLHFNPILASGSHTHYLPYLRYIDPFVGAFVAIGLIVLHQSLLHPSSASPNIPLRILSWRPLVKLGTISYSLYLVHLPVLKFIANILDRKHSINSHILLEEAILVVVGLPAIIAVSYGFFLVCERPFMSARSSKDKTLPPTTASSVS